MLLDMRVYARRRIAFVMTVSVVGLVLALMGCRRQVIPPGPPPADIATSDHGALGGGGMDLEVTQVLPTPTPGPFPTATPTRTPPETAATTYTVRPGDTLLRIAALYGTTVESLMRINQLTNPDQIKVGQVLNVSVEAEHVGPGEQLIPDSELVYGPGYRTFDVQAAVAGYPGLLAHYSETVGMRELSGAEIVELIANQYSVGPRVLLALLELRGGWLTNPDPSPTQRTYPMGYLRGAYWDGLYMQLAQAANALNGGFYGWWLDTLWLVQVGNGVFVQFAPTLNAGTAGVQKMLADTALSYDAWVSDLERFAQVYQGLFGDPFAYEVSPLVSPATEAPSLQLPWPKGETWFYTGGPHPGWGTVGAYAAIDFTTDEEHIGCAVSRHWVTAVADGLVVVSEDGMVLQDLDGDGFVGTGWVVLYMHIASHERVAAGTMLKAGDHVGHPSCEGGVSDASHLHLARRVNGVWIPADDANWPMVLDGWRPIEGANAYDGTLVHGDEMRTACECWDVATNGVTH